MDSLDLLQSFTAVDPIFFQAKIHMTILRSNDAHFIAVMHHLSEITGQYQRLKNSVNSSDLRSGYQSFTD